jgi:hypothetical protein
LRGHRIERATDSTGGPLDSDAIAIRIPLRPALHEAPAVLRVFGCRARPPKPNRAGRGVYGHPHDVVGRRSVIDSPSMIDLLTGPWIPWWRRWFR